LFCYFLLYTLPSEGRAGLIFWEQPFLRVWHPVVQWVAVHIFHIAGHAATYFETGSGDTTLDYVENYCYVVLAFIGTMVWSLLDRKRTNYITLHSWFRIWLRYTLAATLFGYGFAKVFPLQMHLYLPVMLEHWGDSSPMAVLWNFMAASAPYTILCGSAEALAGVLLLFRRTTLLGAIISIGVMFNIAALNFCYDVPVKLYSTNLLLMSIYVLGPDWPRLKRILLLNQPVAAADLSRPVFTRHRMRIAAWIVRGTILYFAVVPSWKTYKRIYLNPKHPALYGLYEVESFSRNGKEPTTLVTEGDRWHGSKARPFATPPESLPLRDGIEHWHWVYVRSSDDIAVVFLNDKRKNFGAKQDAAKNTLTVSSDKETSIFQYTWPATNDLILRPAAAKDTNDNIEMHLRPVPPSEFLLLNRGFHWISEYPFSR
jgi:hypothetical protein